MFGLCLIPWTLWEAGMVSAWQMRALRLRASEPRARVLISESQVGSVLLPPQKHSICWRCTAKGLLCAQGAGGISDTAGVLGSTATPSIKAGYFSSLWAQWEGTPSGQLGSFIWVTPGRPMYSRVTQTCKMGKKEWAKSASRNQLK